MKQHFLWLILLIWFYFYLFIIFLYLFFVFRFIQLTAVWKELLFTELLSKQDGDLVDVADLVLGV